MRFTSPLLIPFLLAACGASKQADTAAPPTALATCPTQLTASTPLPKGARLLGRPAAAMTLFDAEVSMDAPEDVTDDRALSRVEQDEDKPLPGKRYLYRYDVEPAPLESPGQFERYLLACRYGTNADAAMREKADSALLLVPLPYKTKARCDVISEQYQPGVAKKPLISASCERSG
jgi:hypothetical protein